MRILTLLLLLTTTATAGLFRHRARPSCGSCAAPAYQRPTVAVSPHLVPTAAPSQAPTAAAPTPAPFQPPAYLTLAAPPVYPPGVKRPPSAVSFQADQWQFDQAINWYRGVNRLTPLGHDAGLSAAAATNNALQARHGMGHWYAPAAQCVAGNAPSAGAAAAIWYASPAHQAIMLAPMARSYGVDWSGGYWTLHVR